VMNIVAARLWHAVACLSALLEASSTTPRVPSMSLRRPSHESRLNYSLQPAAYFSLHACPAFPSPASQITDDLPRDVSSMRDDNSPAIFRLVSLVSHVSSSCQVKEISRAVGVGVADCVLLAYAEQYV
jgi:hypothetical protein